MGTKLVKRTFSFVLPLPFILLLALLPLPPPASPPPTLPSLTLLRQFLFILPPLGRVQRLAALRVLRAIPGSVRRATLLQKPGVGGEFLSVSEAGCEAVPGGRRSEASSKSLTDRTVVQKQSNGGRDFRVSCHVCGVYGVTQGSAGRPGTDQRYSLN